MLLESVRGLTASGANVVVALPQQGELVPHLLSAGARVVIIPMLVLRKALLRPANWPHLFAAASRGFAAAVRLLRRIRPDVVLVNTVTLPQWPVASAITRTQCVTHIHEAEASGSPMLNRAVYLPHLLSEQTIVNSAFTRQTMGRAFSRLADRSTLVWNGVEGPSDPRGPRTELNAVHLLYVGRLSPRKGPDIAIAALSVLRGRGCDADLTLLGSAFTGYEWFEKKLRDEVDAQGLTDHVEFAGFTEDVWPVFAASDLVLVPSLFDEPFGNVAVEGVLAERPVVASGTSGLREAVGDYPSAVLVPPGDAERLADAVESIVRAWPEMAARTAASSAAARSRHAPHEYHRAVSRIVIGEPHAS